MIPPSIPRVALVTGGARRLGQAIAFGLAEAGFDVAVHHRGGPQAAAETLDGVRVRGRRAVALAAELAREAEVAPLLPAAATALGPVGVLVNNASVFERDDALDATRASWDAHLEPNLRAPFVLSQAFARALPAAAEGVIVNLLDQRVWSLTPYFTSYTVSKAALWALTRQLALALAPRIRVVAVGPGPALPSARQSAEAFAQQGARTPLRRGTDPQEVARAAMALLSLPSVTGQMLALDGGQHLQWAPETDQAAGPVE